MSPRYACTITPNTELFDAPSLGMDEKSLLDDIKNFYGNHLAQDKGCLSGHYIYTSLALALRDRLFERMKHTKHAYADSKCKQTYYLSLEFLMGGAMGNAVLNLGLDETITKTLNQLGLEFEDLVEQEHDAGLGNGGLGRLAAWSDQLAHGQQFEHFEPGHLSLAIRQALTPERAQVQFIPETTGQPAIAEDAWMLQRQLRQLDLEPVEDIGREVAVFGEEADLLGELSGFVERVETFAPGRLLRVIDLAHVKDGALSGVTGAQAAVFDDAPVAMHLAVLFAGVVAQKHIVGRQCITAATRCGRG